MWYRAEANFLREAVPQAREDYHRALRAHPYHVHTLNNLATCYQRGGDRNKAIAYYEQVLSIAPRFSVAACNLAAIHFNAGDFEKADRILVRCDPEGRSALTERYRRIIRRRMREGRVLSPEADPAAHTPDGSAAVFRLWASSTGRPFYTMDPQERDRLLARPGDTWAYEGIDFHAYTGRSVPGLRSVHRFYAPELESYFYTIDPSEVAKLLHDDSRRWQHQGVAFFAFSQGRQPQGARPVYRFWAGRLGYHLFTIDESEKDELMEYHANTWIFEGVAWYAYP
jgi:hypothetical protein